MEAMMRSMNEATKQAKAQPNGTGAATTAPKWQELGLSQNDLKDMYYNLVLARTLDERMWLLNRQGKTAFVISCAGQEATQVGFARAMKAGYDNIWPYYRNLALVLSLGMTPRE